MIASEIRARLLEIEAELSDLEKQAADAGTEDSLSPIRHKISRLTAEREKIQEEPGGDDKMIPTPG